MSCNMPQRQEQSQFKLPGYDDKPISSADHMQIRQ